MPLTMYQLSIPALIRGLGVLTKLLDKAEAFGRDNGIRFARYENALESGRGDEYNEFYFGVNKYFYGHKLKWQTGVQYTTMDDNADDGGDYDGWGVTTGIRISW